MPALARRDWFDLKQELIRRMGGRTESSFATRAEHWLDAAQLDIGLTFHHFELDKVTEAVSLASGTSTVNLPADCYIVMGVALKDPATAKFKKWVELQHLRYVQANFSSASAVPGQYARFGSLLQFNCTSDQTYPLILRYYKSPDAPDFADGAASPELSRLWDEHLLETALAKAHGALWRADLAGMAATTLKDFLAAQVQPALLAELVPDRPTVPTKNRTHGGAQG